MPSGRDWPLATDQMSSSHPVRSEWDVRVRLALEAQNTDELGELFNELVDSMGSEKASHVWLEAMSAWDSSAVTG